jgi:hypothetical protein
VKVKIDERGVGGRRLMRGRKSGSGGSLRDRQFETKSKMRRTPQDGVVNRRYLKDG